mgnify:CR=1 FL=1
MTTRATYNFANLNMGSTTFTLYDHYDGYPSGAADKLQRAINYPNRRGNLTDAFLRANDTAELTLSHDFHGDTEFAYNITKTQIPAFQYHVNAWKRLAVHNEDLWHEFFQGPLNEFLDVYAEQD